MTQFNQITLIGRFGRDPEMSYTPSGQAVTKCSLAVNRPKKKAANGDKQEQPPLWINVICWQKLAEIVNHYGRKGSLVLVQGTFDARTYTDRNQVKQTACEVTASAVQLLDKRRDEDDASEDPLGNLEDHPF
ncbi:MAG: single-stranded DNA-binding protein [Ktedonobacteraceae bacterium]|nr:single-stranded DNA-binding protein [Ktedonobacteraceae bacterium]